MDEFIKIRQKLEVLKAIPESEWIFFTKIFQLKKFKKGEYIVEAGQFSNSFGFIKEGLVRFFYTDQNENELNQTFKKEEDYILSWQSIFNKTPSTFSIQALEDSCVYLADYLDFEPFLERHICWPQLCYGLAQQDYLIKAKREELFLSNDAQERYEYFLKNFPHLATRLTQVQIASYLGISAETLSRIIKKR